MKAAVSQRYELLVHRMRKENVTSLGTAQWDQGREGGNWRKKRTFFRASINCWTSMVLGTSEMLSSSHRFTEEKRGKSCSLCLEQMESRSCTPTGIIHPPATYRNSRFVFLGGGGPDGAAGVPSLPYLSQVQVQVGGEALCVQRGDVFLQRGRCHLQYGTGPKLSSSSISPTQQPGVLFILPEKVQWALRILQKLIHQVGEICSLKCPPDLFHHLCGTQVENDVGNLLE